MNIVSRVSHLISNLFIIGYQYYEEEMLHIFAHTSVASDIKVSLDNMCVYLLWWIVCNRHSFCIYGIFTEFRNAAASLTTSRHPYLNYHSEVFH